MKKVFLFLVSMILYPFLFIFGTIPTLIVYILPALLKAYKKAKEMGFESSILDFYRLFKRSEILISSDD